ncbi:hypothetical protein [Brevibacillus fulvus]|uniref:Uncharacterized protein (DUF305 family) n=1 Tax=Brevibacillus fulvus TaxID=1125967 RepID=A0A939BN77_9BACL|nr:hypothetical protein [Brevibacillus fulvus]MBM7588540.1 uncharacterized protein (DUF305 family) [Brevibacillus fulvus]
MKFKKWQFALFYILALSVCAGIYMYATQAEPTGSTVDVQAEQKPGMEVTYALHGKDLHLQLTVTNFTFSLENMGKENKAGEGHVHLYMDGKKVAKIFDRQFVYKDIPAGHHEMVVELAKNNHESYGIKKSFQIHVQ